MMGCKLKLAYNMHFLWPSEHAECQNAQMFSRIIFHNQMDNCFINLKYTCAVNEENTIVCHM